MLRSKAFPDGGVYILRHSNLYMIVDCSPLDPRPPPAHKHNSRLSFELFAYDKSFIIDPGSYIYTANKNMRNLFRSTAYHNTVVVDDNEQNRIDERDLFSIKLDAGVNINSWQVTNTYDFLDAEHYGYTRLMNPIIHRRQIYFNKEAGYWLIKDLLEGKGCHKFDLFFHFSPIDIMLDREYPFLIRSKDSAGWNLAIFPLDTNNLFVEIKEGWISYSYGTKIRAPIIKYSKRSSAPIAFINVLYPFKDTLAIETLHKKIKQNYIFSEDF